MMKKIQQGFENIIPFLILGVAIALIVGLFIMFSYVLFWGLIVGAILWSISFLKNLFLPEKKITNSDAEKEGRIIEHDDEI